MADEKLSKEQVEEQLNDMPEFVQKLRNHGKPLHVDELFTGDMESQREGMINNGLVTTQNAKGERVDVSGIVDKDGYVWSLAATMSRNTPNTMDFLGNIGDYQIQAGDQRQLEVPRWYSIYHKEGIVNNAINTSAALISNNGNFYVRRARQGNRKISGVEEELQVILDFWKKKVNSTVGGAVTSARGLPAVIDQASRQSMIEGSWIGYMTEKQQDIPGLGKSYTLPMYIQSLSTEYVSIPDALVGTGLEQFMWEPPSEVIGAIVEQDAQDDRLSDILKDAFDPEMAKELEDYGNLMLDPQRVIHIKFRGVDTEPFGESFIQPVVADLVYKKALQSLDFVTIDSIVNRILIIKVGSDKPDSDYHNLEFSQKRLLALRRLIGTDPGPNMTLLWAGPDIDVVDVGVHNGLVDIDGRYDSAFERIIYSMGVPKALLNGEATGQVWAGYEGYRESLRALKNRFQQAMISIGERIAELNGFEGVDLHFEFDRSLLSDHSKSADLALRARRLGISSIRQTINVIGGDYETERRNRLLEMGFDPEEADVPSDDIIFSPPAGLPGDTRIDTEGNVENYNEEGGRPPDSQREDLDDERDPESRGPSIEE